jgi:glutamate/tyrosine decarboxylase-like PLP-dependent enzyme
MVGFTLDCWAGMLTLVIVDGASGAFVAPFVTVSSSFDSKICLLNNIRSLNWSGISKYRGLLASTLRASRISPLHSIKLTFSSRGHKFGLAYVGVGWVVWRDKQHLPKDLIFELHYL